MSSMPYGSYGVGFGEVSKLEDEGLCLSLATVSLNSRVNRHPPSERPNNVEAT